MEIIQVFDDFRSTPQTIKDNDEWKFRRSQNKARKALKKTKHAVLNAPTGWGKSAVCADVIVNELKSNPKRKVIIATPQINITNSFAEAFDRYKVAPTNLCDTKSLTSLRSFCKNKASKSIHERIVVTTHAALTQAVTDVKQLRNTSVYIDEAHHSKSTQVELFGELLYEANTIGSIVDSVLKSRSSANITLMTATFFRGDRLSIVSEKHKHLLEKVDVKYDEYLDEIAAEGFEGFTYNFGIFTNNYVKAIREMESRFGECLAVYIPHTSSSLVKNKILESNKICETLNSAGFNTLNMVDERGRWRKYKEMRDNNDVNAFVFMGIGKEGFNRRDVDTIVIVGPRNLQEIIQIIGRGLRSCKGKRGLNVYHLLPYSVQYASEEKQRENVRNFLNTVAAAMVSESIFHPVRWVVKNGKKKRVVTTSKFEQIIHDEVLRAKIHNNVIRKVVALGLDGVSEINKRFDEIVGEELDTFEIDKRHVKVVAKQIWAQHCVANLRFEGYDIKNIDFDLIDRTENPFGYLEHFSKQIVCGTLGELREILYRYDYTIEDLQKHAEERGGKCLSDEYKGAHKKYKWQCEYEHEIWLASWDNIKGKKSWCPVCNRGLPVSDLEFENLAKDKGGKFLRCESKIIGNKLYKFILIECNNKHVFSNTPTNLRYGRWCPKCAPTYKKSKNDYIEMGLQFGLKLIGDIPQNTRISTVWQYQGCKHYISSSYGHLKARHRQCNQCAAEEKTMKIWMTKYILLKSFYDKNGHSNVSRGNNSPLSHWVHNQRNFYKKGKLTTEQISLLEDVQFQFYRR